MTEKGVLVSLKRKEEMTQALCAIDGFEEFWRAYPRRVGKLMARKAYDRARLSITHAVLLEAVAQQKTWAQWTRDAGQYIPHPATWLNQGRWDDEPPEQLKTVLRPEQRLGKQSTRLLAAIANLSDEGPA